jgi:DNA transformation protein
MSASNVDKEFVSYVVELMQPLGPVHAKAMFGGHGVFLKGLMFALIADNVVYLKADKDTANEFIEKGLEAFTYNKKGKQYKMSYYRAPEEALEDGEEMNIWASKAYSAAIESGGEKINRVKWVNKWFGNL